MNMDRMIRHPTGGTGVPQGSLRDATRRASFLRILLKKAKGMVTIENLFQILNFVKRI
jgi:hypothetical protein